MACLDAAARFTPALTILTTGVNREHANAAGPTTQVVATVKDRIAADKARSEFSMISAQISSVVHKCQQLALQHEGRG